MLLLCVPSSCVTLQQPTSGNDYEAMRPQCKSLAVNLSTISQLVGSFRHTYKEELQPWTTKDAPTFSGVLVWLVTLLLGCERRRGTHDVLRLVKKTWCTFVPILCNVCAGLGPAFKQLHSYVDDLAQVGCVVHYCDTQHSTFKVIGFCMLCLPCST